MDPLERFKTKDPLKIKADERIALIMREHPAPFGKMVGAAMMRMTAFQPMYVMALHVQAMSRNQGDDLFEVHYEFVSKFTCEHEASPFASLIWYTQREPTTVTPPDSFSGPTILHEYSHKFTPEAPHPLAILVSVITNEVVHAGWIPVHIDYNHRRMIYAGWDGDISQVHGVEKIREVPNDVLKIEFVNPNHPLKVCVLHLNYAPLLKEHGRMKQPA